MNILIPAKVFTLTILLTLGIGASFPVWASETYQSGFQRSSMPDPMGGEMAFSIWYPSHVPETKIRLGPFQLSVANGATPADGRFGLILISHGTGGSDLGHRDVARALAHNGFIVVSVLHPRDNFRDNSGIGERIVWEGRPRQIVALLDHLLTTPDWQEVIDPNRIGLLGFSAGGYTMLSVVGAEHDPLVFAQHCETNTEDPLCKNFRDIPTRMRETKQKYYQLPVKQIKDHRIGAAVIVDPMAAIFSDDTLVNLLDIPLHFYQPEIENELLWKYHGGRIIRILNQQERRHLPLSIQVPDAHHFSFISPFPDEIAKEIPHIANDRAGFDRPEFHQQLGQDVSGFFMQNLP